MNHTGKLALSATSADRQSATGPAQSSPMKKLQPLNETINGLPVYGNQEGQRFTVRIVTHAAGFESPGYHVEIKAVTDSETPQIVVGTVVCDYSTLFIQRIRHGGPGENPREYSFILIMIEQLRKIANETGRQFVSILPDNERLREYCAEHGFQGAEEGRNGQMRLKV
ncbi:hypothetical protein H0O00_02270 [Candidatus Micrarchaeota archaeon]|nr:hypothetical protein [Candidatus Micrarchaeota archaeon]